MTGPDMNVVVHRLKRVVEIWKLLNHQVDVLETMTPLDFLEFRELLHGASGFQSKQFREIEASLGLQIENRFRPDYYKHTDLGGFNEKDFAEITEFEKRPSILQMVENWLERMPFFNEEFWRDWGEAPGKSDASGRPLSGPVTALFTSKVFPNVTTKSTSSANSTTFSSRPDGALFGRRLCAPPSSSCFIVMSRCSVSLSRF